MLQERVSADEASFFSAGEARYRTVPEIVRTGQSYIQRPRDLPFFSLSLEIYCASSKNLPALRLALVAIGVVKADTIRRGRQGLHGENNFASVNLNQLPDMAV